MVTPAKGDYASIPINLAAKNVADTWDPAKDEAAGEQCRSYGAPAIMRIPERIHITWQDDQTLKVETDAGQQTRLFHFGDWKPSTNVPATWQGDSVAAWEIAGANAIFASAAFERRLRDISTLLQQAQGRKSHLQDAGAFLLGHEANLAFA